MSVSGEESNPDAQPLLIAEETLAKVVRTIEIRQSIITGHVWGDIYRNQFLKDVKDPPAGLTPNPDSQEYHHAI